jgi:pyrroline-5-carboxylate reductase
MRIGLIGCGVMGSAFARSIKSPLDWRLHSRREESAQALAKELSSAQLGSIAELKQHCELILIAVKPWQVEHVTPELAGYQGLVLSMVAGLRLQRWRDLLPSARVSRCLPNLAIQQGEGVVGLVDDPKLQASDRQILSQLCEGMGWVAYLEESKLEALSALAGSGPGFVYMLMEAFTEAGIQMGLKAQEALDLTAQTFKGAAVMVQQEQKHPAELKWQVAAPGGTTIAGLLEMEGRGVRAGIAQGILETRARADQH